MSAQTFTHIEAFYNVRKNVKFHFDELPTVNYQGTIKLHGTHAAIEFKNGSIRAMSRTRYISPESDNYGFAKFILGDEQQNAIKRIIMDIKNSNVDILDEDVIILYGEFIGPGIQRGVGINSLSERQWVLFSVGHLSTKNNEFKYINALTPFHDVYTSASIYSINDVRTFDLQINFADELQFTNAVNQANVLTLAVEANCPWSKKFGIDGIGEGIVWVPIDKYENFPFLVWKSKGPKHSEVKSKTQSIQIDPEILNSMNEFVEFAITDVRLTKGLDHIKSLGYLIEQKNTGVFLKWLKDDILRECRDEISKNNFDDKILMKFVSQRAVTFWRKQIKQRGI